MTKDQIKKISEGLDALDSHGIYSAEALKELEPGGVVFDSKKKTLTIPSLPLASQKRTMPAPLQSPTQVRSAMRKRGLGGSLDATHEGPLFSGFDIAETLCQLLGLGNPGAMYSGRGRRFRACADAIRTAGMP